ncbi:hypothetical protein [Hyphomicrobium sp.]|uniref:hypothetical protein n=1 Tax=Hyphomicrobium sp. TaxID=82 RepID=UPI000FC08CCD|nr:hypothetical protein [Hyphomicrobium sp.]RUP07394.1 MAG: hypothetical protein EKK38_19750 [Hyphomicrobium sp.]
MSRSARAAVLNKMAACAKGLVFSLESFLKDELVERQFGYRLLQALILPFEILEALGLIVSS